MALEAFNNLKEKKKNMIFDGISNCLRKDSIDNISICDMAEEAGISRGSFYNYFVDKNDAVHALVANKLYKKIQYYIESIEKRNGDMFEATIDLCNNIKDELKDRVSDIFLNNFKTYINIVMRILYSGDYNEKVIETVKWIKNNTNIGKEYIKDMDEMKMLLEMIMSAASHELGRYFVKKDNENFENLKRKLEIIKNGIVGING